MLNEKFIVPKTIDKAEIKRMRMKAKLTQKEFALLLNVDTRTVEKWESKEGPIKGVIVSAILMLQMYPDFIDKTRIPTQTLPLRLYYMYKQETCTIIDVDERNKKIEVHNYKQDNIFTAFGKKEHPNYEDYLDFLQSRCFPKERDKLKLVLNDLGVPFYDPYLIVEKTEGRMAEDEFWIKIVRK